MPEPLLDQMLLSYLGGVWQGEADIGECLDTASRVEPEDEFSWAREWIRTAERIRQVAQQAEVKGQLSRAGEAWLRSSTYYRAALHCHPEPRDPDGVRWARHVLVGFTRALRLLGVPAQPVLIPYEGTSLPGYFFRSPVARERAPVVIVHPGRDAWAEDCKYLAEGAIKRGYHCLLFEGPGQGKALRLQGLALRPDWEKVVTPVVDWVLTQPGVDAERIALVGIGMGGSLAPRAAAFEKRLKLCVANPGVYNWGDIVSEFIASIDPGLIPLVDIDRRAFDARMSEWMEVSRLLRWGMKDAMWKHGAASPSEALLQMRSYSNKGFAERITCRMLVMDSTGGSFGQGLRLYEALRCPKDYLLLTEEDAAQAHWQAGALSAGSQCMFEWLDVHL